MNDEITIKNGIGMRYGYNWFQQKIISVLSEIDEIEWTDYHYLFIYY